MLIVVMTAFLIVFGFAIGYAATGIGWFGIVIAVVMAVAMTLTSYYKGDKIALATSHARQVTHDEAPQLFNVVEEMAIAREIPFRRFTLLMTRRPMPLQTGRNPEKSSIAVTQGLLDIMNRDELQGVIAHEMSHVRNYDILFRHAGGSHGWSDSPDGRLLPALELPAAAAAATTTGCSALSCWSWPWSWPSSLPLPPAWSSWPSPASANIWPTPGGRAYPESRRSGQCPAENRQRSGGARGRQPRHGPSLHCPADQEVREEIPGTVRHPSTDPGTDSDPRAMASGSAGAADQA